MLQGLRGKLRIATVLALTLWTGLLGLYGLLKPISNGCVMTYMYPTYIPISMGGGAASSAVPGKYGLYLYHEGWKKIDFDEHVKQLSGVPVLFIPGNGGSFKQVRSLAAESDRAYQGGALEKTYHFVASLTAEEGGINTDKKGFRLPNQYGRRLDWFAVDLEGEHSAMDGRILEEHTEYVVYAINRILDQYKESHDAREKEGAAVSSNLPKSVILVGHSMGGFVARAATIHPRLRKSAVETILTLSTPHQSPPVALQPSLSHYFANVNQAWKRGYEVQTTQTGHYMSYPLLSHVVIVSISGGYNDYQVRSKLETLDDIVPPTHGFTISSTSMRNVWLSMEHQAILWCNQLVVQVCGFSLPESSLNLLKKF
uniref:GPI inositol-deacylase n=1 Tax=Rhizophora mucronata TaxID=61149 RepID=A0A2P2K414_RHIMU